MPQTRPWIVEHLLAILLVPSPVGLGDAEVAHLHEVGLAAPLDEHDVARLEVAVDDALGVGLVERGHDLRHDSHDARERQREVVAKDLREIAAREQLHGDVERAVGVLARVDDLDRVRVVQFRGALRLALEAPHELLVVHEVGVQHLHGDGLAERELLALVHVAHRPLADQLLDAEVARDDATGERVQAFEGRVLFLRRAHGPRRRHDTPNCECARVAAGSVDRERGGHGGLTERRAFCHCATIWARPSRASTPASSRSVRTSRRAAASPSALAEYT